MALDKFRASPLPNPPAEYDSQYVRQLIRALETYFSQLDSRTPNNAQKYTADEFVGGNMQLVNLTTTEKNALNVPNGALIFDSTLGKLCVKTAGGWQTVTSV